MSADSPAAVPYESGPYESGPYEPGPSGPASSLAASFDAAAEGVAGVRALYAARPLALRLAGRLGSDDQPRSHVQDGADSLDVTVSVGVDGRVDCAEVAERVAAGIRDAGSPVPVETVRVRVSRLVFDA